MVLENIKPKEIKSYKSVASMSELDSKANWYTLSPYFSEDWLGMLFDSIFSEEMEEIFSTLKERASHEAIFPSFTKMFNAFKYCKWSDLKVIIIGDEPYNVQGVSDGLAFSAKNCSRNPPKLLKNILEEVTNDVYTGITPDQDNEYNLKRWAEQGVLLLNLALTTEEGSFGVHADLWEWFIIQVIETIDYYNPSPLVYMLWGQYPQMYREYITQENHKVLMSGGPLDTDGINKFKGSKHFSKANDFLSSSYGKTGTIKW
jgi:uracil-DNA glycosylase